MAQKYGTERTGRTMPCNVCGKLYTDNIDKSAKEITCPYCIMKGGIVQKSNSEIKTTNLKEKIMPTKQGRIKPTDFTSSFKKYVNGVAETITINQHKTWKEMVKEVLGMEVYEKNKHASMYLVYKKYLDKSNDPNLYLEKIGEDPAEVIRTPEPVVETEPEKTETAQPDEVEPEIVERDEEGNIIERDEEGNVIGRPETTQPETQPETQPILTESDVNDSDADSGDINGSEIGGDTGIDADKNE